MAEQKGWRIEGTEDRREEGQDVSQVSQVCLTPLGPSLLQGAKRRLQSRISSEGGGEPQFARSPPSPRGTPHITDFCQNFLPSEFSESF